MFILSNLEQCYIKTLYRRGIFSVAFYKLDVGVYSTEATFERDVATYRFAIKALFISKK